MTFYVLLVEDDQEFVEELQETIANLPVNCELILANSRDQAIEVIESRFIDVVILDLKIPTISHALDADPEHGHAVFSRIRAEAPGTPIFILTGSPAEDFFPELLRHQQQIDIWSEGRKTGTIQFLKKFDIDRFPEQLGAIARAVERLNDVELDRGGLELCTAEDRLIRIFAKKFRGVRCVASKLGDGRSGARVIRLRVTDAQGVQIHDAVAKLSTPEKVRDEGDRYDNHVTRLDGAATPRKLAYLEFGGNKLAGVFYGLADGFDQNAFDVAGGEPEQVRAVVLNLESATARWNADVPETRHCIREIRRRLLLDEKLEAIQQERGLPWIEDFENREIQAHWGCCHGDLHGCNVLISPSSIALIDYGDVEEGPASLDPVTLELSLVLNPDSPNPPGAWPSEDQARNWGNLDAYLENCPFPNLVRECREWAVRVAAGNREIAASAYSYTLRQLKYPDTDKNLAVNLLDGIRSFYDGDT